MRTSLPSAAARVASSNAALRRDDELIGGKHELGAHFVLRLRLRRVDQPSATLVFESGGSFGRQREHHVLVPRPTR